MKKLYAYLSWAGLVSLLILTAACSPAQAMVQSSTNTPAAASTPVQATYGEPFSYCAAVGAIDHPDGRYTGPKVPDEIIQGYIKAAGLTTTTEPNEIFQQTTIWRCMDNKVYVCNFGANLPCDSKADTNKTPTQAMADFCKDNQGSEFIPMSVTGHTTIYSWHCVKDVPTLLDQVEQVDAAGYLQRIWYKLEPGS